MKEKDVKRIEKELDRIMNKFDNEEFISQDFENYSKIIKQSYYKNQRLHRKRRECEVIGCKKKTIKKSHSIPKTSILQNISSNGHLLKPEFYINNSPPTNKMVKVGIHNASVFPGFCEKHENIFKSFEIDGKINNDQKAILQTYRTICRERVFREIELEINEIAKTEYKKKINNDALKCINEVLSKYPQFNKIEEIDINGVDSVINSLNKLNSYLSEPIQQFKEFEENIFSWLLNLSYKNDLIVRVTNIDLHLPVSICGFGSQEYIEKSERKEAYVLLNVMPQKNSTDIVCVGLKQDQTIVEKYFDFFLADPLNILNMIESFMVNGTDQWYINPDFWKTIPRPKQEKILYDILFTEDSFLDEYPVSIFDNIRRDIISVLKENISKRGYGITKIEKKRINYEMNKLEKTNFEMIKDEKVLIDKLYDKLKKH
ncbi:MAG: hypothetical protein ACOCP4_03895 [Candidatus Woesearchaeota archaeon]